MQTCPECNFFFGATTVNDGHAQTIELARRDVGYEYDPFAIDHVATTLTPGLYKARPHTEGDERYVYCEPSNENVDGDGERIMQKALADSRDDFLAFGNLDIEHLSLLVAALLGERRGLKPNTLSQINTRAP